MANEETETMKIKDLFETTPLLAGRTQIESSFAANKDDFLVDANNILNLKNKTSYASIAGCQFQIYDNGAYNNEDTAGGLQINTDISPCYATIQLPHGAIITSAVIYGNISDETWILKRITSDGTSSTLATANFNTADTSINNATIDNSTYAYFFQTSSLDSTDVIYNAMITYTTDYI